MVLLCQVYLILPTAVVKNLWECEQLDVQTMCVDFPLIPPYRSKNVHGALWEIVPLDNNAIFNIEPFA